MSVKQVIKLESEAVTSQSVTIPFEFSDRSSIPDGKPPGDTIVIKPITVRTWERLKPLFVLIEQEDKDRLVALKDSVFNSEVELLISKYDNLIFEIVCIGIHNKKGDMP